MHNTILGRLDLATEHCPILLVRHDQKHRRLTKQLRRIIRDSCVLFCSHLFNLLVGQGRTRVIVYERNGLGYTLLGDVVPVIRISMLVDFPEDPMKLHLETVVNQRQGIADAWTFVV